MEQYGLVNDLIDEIKALILDYPDKQPQLINAIEQLNVMKAKRLGEFTTFRDVRVESPLKNHKME